MTGTALTGVDRLGGFPTGGLTEQSQFFGNWLVFLGLGKQAERYCGNEANSWRTAGKGTVTGTALTGMDRPGGLSYWRFDQTKPIFRDRRVSFAAAADWRPERNRANWVVKEDLSCDSTVAGRRGGV